MDVFDHGQQSGRLGDIAIIPAASLPESIMDFSIGLFVAEPAEKLWALGSYHVGAAEL